MLRAAGGAIIRQPTCAVRKPRMSTATRKDGGDPLDAGVATGRSTRASALRSVPKPGAGSRAEARMPADREPRDRAVLERQPRSTGDPCRDHQSSDDL
ncbi:hypothetical protein DIE04_19530 [Burkholderia sp. Bp8994]|nr:hypothetical protein DIE20_15535 [Burkholderia sp. Bp9131]RQR71406.1 hypothetical protein DIE12_18495 [Burkholderia sp. Bp9015]RQR81434.1 hypothetical protein DIE10_17675 [Burkholderia sp. Bp9011]RQR91009.1 hypothetical protein DIE09_19910 [Burkholderia sp. Bp9010]RQR94030.1 hypothetical protein DIE04_19530 [Burkholderia sp. Bp8994]RQS03603.1 hypothetical protein DIE02_20025 [Burkholderia sp. Bp8991]RQS27776.1 hypothetical protein DIE05_17065 [Burkholderia sp. Bp8995]RQS38237.1 hypothetic